MSSTDYRDDDRAEHVAMESAYEMQRDDDPQYIADPAEYIGLPAPDLGAVAAHVQGDAELETRVRDIIHQREQGPASILSRRTAARQIIAMVREHDRRASHEGATVSALTAERFGPAGGER